MPNVARRIIRDGWGEAAACTSAPGKRKAELWAATGGWSGRLTLLDSGVRRTWGGSVQWQKTNANFPIIHHD